MLLCSLFTDAALIEHPIHSQQVSDVNNHIDVCLLVSLNDLHGAVCDCFNLCALHMPTLAEGLAPPACAWQCHADNFGQLSNDRTVILKHQQGRDCMIRV